MACSPPVYGAAPPPGNMPFLVTQSNAGGDSLLYNCKRWRYTVVPRVPVPASDADFIWTLQAVDAQAPGLEGLAPPAQNAGDGYPTAPWPMPTYPAAGALCPSTRPEFQPHLEYCRSYGAVVMNSSAVDGAYLDWFNSSPRWTSKTLYAQACWRYQRYCCTLNGDGTPRYDGGVPRADYACLSCAGATYSIVSNEGYCCDSANPCPSGQVWCATSGACIPKPPPPPCATQLHCYYSPTSCGYHCDTPYCPTGYTWDAASCSCKPAGPPPPPCSTQLHCVYNTAFARWDCDNPTAPGYCPAGYTWDWPSCACVNRCPTAGTCWCAPSQSCVRCPPFPCATELHCAWDVTDCRYHCDDPTAAGYCPSGQHWSWKKCACVPDTSAARHPWTLAPQAGGYEKAWTEDDAIRYRRWPFETPEGAAEFTVQATAPTATQADDYGRMIEDAAGENRLLVFTRTEAGASKVLSQWSYDNGETWTAPMDLITGAAAGVPLQLANGDILVAAVKGTKIAAKVWEAAAATWGAEFNFQTAAGGVLTDLTVPAGSTFHYIQAAEDAERVILSVDTATGSAVYWSADPGAAAATWTPL